MRGRDEEAGTVTRTGKGQGITGLRAVTALLLFAPALSAQPPEPAAWEVGVDFGTVIEYPEPLIDCGVDVGSVTATALHRFGPVIGVSASTSAGFALRSDACPLPLHPVLPIGPGSREVRSRIGEGLLGPDFVASEIEIVVDAAPGRPLTIRFLGGGGRLWTGGRWTWTAGGEVGYRWSGGVLIAGVRGRWFDYSFEQDLIEYDEELRPVLLKTERVEESATPVTLRIGYRMRIR